MYQDLPYYVRVIGTEDPVVLAKRSHAHGNGGRNARQAARCFVTTVTQGDPLS